MAPRYTAITRDNSVVLTLSNFGGDDSAPEVVQVPLHPKNAAVGTKAITRTSKVIIEQDDARLIKDGEEVRTQQQTQRQQRQQLFASCCCNLQPQALRPLVLLFLSPPFSSLPFAFLMKTRVWFSDFNSC